MLKNELESKHDLNRIITVKDDFLSLTLRARRFSRPKGSEWAVVSVATKLELELELE